MKKALIAYEKILLNESKSLSLIKIIRNDITKVKVDAIINIVNPAAIIGDRIEAAIYKAAGKDELLEARKEIEILKPGEVAVTKAFNLSAHVSCPWWKGGKKNKISCLRDCYSKVLKAAKDNGCESITFPLLDTGNYGIPKELGIQVQLS